MGWLKDKLTSKEEEKAYEDAVDKVKKISAANTADKASMMADQGAAAAGNTASNSATSAAKSAGMNSEAADAVGANIGNTVTQNAFNNEFNKAVEANQQEVAEAEQAANEANKRRAEKKTALGKLGSIAGTAVGGIAGALLGGPAGASLGAGIGGGLGNIGGNALSDEKCKDKWLIDSISKYRKSKLKNKRLIDRSYD